MEQASHARRVFILGMDGAGNFLQRLKRSEISRLARQHGVVTLDAMTELPTISAECRGSMLHGVTPDKHGYHNERAGAERFPLDSAYPFPACARAVPGVDASLVHCLAAD